MINSAQLLAEPDAWEKLQQLQTQIAADDVLPADFAAINQELRQTGTPAPLASALTSQLQLRQDARRKFGNLAEFMLFTRSGLEQATRFQVALHHANRYLQAGIESVADLGCGIGTESLALSTCGLRVTALDLDTESATCAAVNLREFPTAEVKIGDITDLTPKTLAGWGAQALFLDPARRDGKGRQFDPENWAPSWSQILDILTWGLPTGLKLAPGIAHEILPAEYHAQWLAVGNQLVEASLWGPTLAPEGPGRSAAILVGGRFHSLQDPNITRADAPVSTAPVGALDQYLYEPGPSVIRAGLVGALAEKTGTHLLYPKIAYLSGPNRVDTVFASGFEVIDDVPLRVKQIRQRLTELGAGPIEVKKRGVQIDTAALQTGLQRPDGEPLVVIATRLGERHRAIITRRLSTAKETQ